MNRGNSSNIGFSDGIYAGFLANKGTGAYDAIIQQGIAMVGDKVISRESALAAVAVPCPQAPGVHTAYLNAAGALDVNSAALAQISFDSEEANITIQSLVGSDATTYGRSLAIANFTVLGNAGTVTLGGTFLAADTVTTTVDGENIVTTFVAADVASLTTAAAKVAAVLNADTIFAPKALATAALGVVTITSKTATAYTLAVAKVSTAGTATASGANLAGGAITSVDNSVQMSDFAPSYSSKIVASYGV